MVKERLPRVAIIHPSLSWYRLPTFRLLAAICPGLTVLFSQCNTLPIYSNRKVRVKKPEDFRSKLFPSYRFFPPPYPNEVTPDIVMELIKEKYDVILWGDSLTTIEALFVFFMCKIQGKPFILWSDEWGMPKPLLRRLVDPIIKFMTVRSSAVISHGKRHSEYFRSLGVKKDKIFVSGSVSWITPSMEDYVVAGSLSNKSTGKKILYIGGLVERKGVQYLIKAFANLAKENENLRLWIVGDGPQKNFLKNLAKELGIEGKVTFFGWINHSRIAPYFLAADVFVLPSWDEPWGLVINEAMSLSKPVVTTYGVGSCLDLVENGVNGFIVPPKDSETLYMAIKKVISSESLLRNMGENSLEIIKNFTYERMASGFHKAIVYALEKGEHE